MPLPPRSLPTMSLLSTASIAMSLFCGLLRVQLRAHQPLLFGDVAHENQRRVELDSALC